MRVIAALAFVLGCSTIAKFPPGEGGGGGQGGGGGGGGGPDSGLHDAPSGEINGRVCVITDLRVLGACAATGASGFTVTLGDSGSATTAADGSFSIVAPSGTNLLWTVTGIGMETSLMAFNGTNVIPMISTTNYTGTASNFGVSDFVDGAIVVQVTRGGVPLQGEVASVTPTPSTLLYDDTAADSWTPESTHANGVVWATGLTGIAANLRVAPEAVGSAGTGSGSGEGEISGIVLGSGAVSFAQLDTF